MADEKYSALPDGGGLAAGDEFAVARSAASLRVTPIGVPVLVYRYTVAGSDKASIDTGVDTADAGSNDWTNGDQLEVFLYIRQNVTGATFSDIAITLNNDSGGNYDRQRLRAQNTTVAAATQIAGSAILASIATDSSDASVFSSVQLVIPAFAKTTVGNKSGWQVAATATPTAANDLWDQIAWQWRSTAAITRLAVASSTAGKLLKVGTELLIYKRLSS